MAKSVAKNVEKEPVRIFVAIDIQNLWYSTQEAYSKTHRMHFRKFRDLLAESLPPDAVVEMIAYVIVSPNHDNDKFINMLECSGYVVKQRKMLYDKSRNIYKKTDWDVGVAVDTAERLAQGKFDVFVLVSGDGDYSYLCERVKSYEKKVMVYSFKKSCSFALINLADEAIMLDDHEDIVFDAGEYQSDEDLDTPATVV